MSARVTYLDSSAIIKRYVREEGTEAVTKSFLKAYSGECQISFNIWNIGEVLGAFDRARSMGRLRASDYSTSRERFIAETKRMNKLGVVFDRPSQDQHAR